MPHLAKRRAFLFLFISLLSVVLLAASLSSLQLQPGAPIPGSAGGQGNAGGRTHVATMDVYSLPLVQGLFSLIFLVLVLYVPVRLLLGMPVNRIFGWVVLLGLLLALVLLLPQVKPVQPLTPAEEVLPVSPSYSDEYQVAPLGEPPPLLIFLVTGAFAAAAGIAIFALVRQSGKAQPSRLQQAAMQAVDELHAGRDFKDVIIRCYMRMVDVLQQEQGLERAAPLTVREFEAQLQARGIPAVPVHQLTRMFEQVRYGNQPVQDHEKQTGLDALNEIIRFCSPVREQAQ
jgi:hypothetical protein